MPWGQSAPQADSPIGSRSNFDLIKRIDKPRESSLPVAAGQANEAPSLHSQPTTENSEPPYEEEGVSSLLTASLPDVEDEFSEDELKEMLFGEDAIEEEPQPVEELPDRKKWIPSFSYKLGFGYSDNPMYGPYVREESGYLEMESELFVLRQGSRNFLTYLYLFGDGKWFEGLPEYDLSGILMAQAEHTYVTDDSAKSFGLRLRHTYNDQAFDFSDLGLPYSMQVQSNKSEVIPHLSHRFSEKITAKIEVSAGSERFDDPSENNSDQQLRVALDWQATEKLKKKKQINFGKYSKKSIWISGNNPQKCELSKISKSSTKLPNIPTINNLRNWTRLALKMIINNHIF